MKKIFEASHEKYSFEFFLDKNFPEKDLITCAFAVVFDEENKIWITKNYRGWELPGGHLEENETLEIALNREIKEEIGVDSGEYDLVGYKKILNFEKTKNRNGGFYPFPNSYIVFFTAKAFSEKKFSFCKDTIDSKLCSFEEAMDIITSENDKIITSENDKIILKNIWQNYKK